MSLNMELEREAQGQLSRATAVGSGAVSPSRDVATGIRGILGTNRQQVPWAPGPCSSLPHRTFWIGTRSHFRETAAPPPGQELVECTCWAAPRGRSEQPLLFNAPHPCELPFASRKKLKLLRLLDKACPQPGAASCLAVGSSTASMHK